MTAIDAIARIQQLQTELTALQGGTSTTSDSGDAFAALLTALQGTGTATTTTTQATTATTTTGTTATAGGDGVTGDQIVADAEKYLGVPYVFGGESTSGMDCSGLVQTVLGDLGISAPRVVQDQASIGTEVPSLDQAQPGDLIIEKGNKHIQIYAGDGMIIEAPKPGENVVKRKEWLSADQIGTIRRVTTAGSGAATDSTTSTAGASATDATQAAQTAAAQSAAAQSAVMQSAATSDLSTLLAQLQAVATSGLTTSFGTDTDSDSDDSGTASLTALASLTAAASAAAVAQQQPAAATALTASVTPAAPLASTTPVEQPALTGQLSGPITQLVQQPDGSHTVVVRVVPEQLGPVTVDARMTDHGLRIELSTPSDAGRDALTGILGDLRRDLAAGGITASVSLGSAAAGQSGAQGGQQNAQQALVDLLEQQRSTAPITTATGSAAASSGTRTSAAAALTTDSVLDVLA